MSKPKMRSPDLAEANVEKIAALFPNCVTESRDDKGQLRRAVDFDLLRQELAGTVVEGPVERYTLNWPGKREAIVAANAPVFKTLRPCEAESVDFEKTRNLYIEGDNLEVLKLLQETYLGQVKMIYIDPPYNTGTDFIYDDDFTMDKDRYELGIEYRDEAGNIQFRQNNEANPRFHSDWLSMMYPRLKLARDLLREDGVLLVNIDEHEVVNLSYILQELFGSSNELGTIIWDKRNPKGDAHKISVQHEYILVWSKSVTNLLSKCSILRPKKNADRILKKAKELFTRINSTYSLEKANADFSLWLGSQADLSGGERAYNAIDKMGNVYQSVSMAWPNKKKAPDNYFIPLLHPTTNKPCPVPERGWRNPPKTMAELMDQGLILFGQDETTQPRRKYLLKDNMKENIPSLLYYGGSDTDLLNTLGIPFDTPKVVNICREHVQCFTEGTDIILDFFSGSATTAHAVMQLNAEDGGNRRFIMVQLPEACDEKSEAFKAGYKNICEIGKERIRRAGRKIKEENATTAPNLDIGFRAFKADSSNMKDVYYTPDEVDQTKLKLSMDPIKEDRTAEDLLFQIFLDFGLDLALPVAREQIDGKTVYAVDGQVLLACFDANIPESLVTAMARRQPLKAVFLDRSFANDSGKINVVQIFKQLAPDTTVKIV